MINMSGKNRVKQILEIEYPVIQGAMAGVSNSDFVAAVSEAGGLGTLQTAFLDEEQLEEEIKKNSRTYRGAICSEYAYCEKGESIRKFLDIAIGKGVEIISLSAGNPKPFLDKIKEAKVAIQVIPHSGLAERCKNMVLI